MKICVNPYHYTKVDQPMLPPAMVPTTERGVSAIDLELLVKNLVEAFQLTEK